MDAHANLAISTVTTAPSPADSGTDLIVASGVIFPDVPFNCTVWAAGSIPEPTTAEIIRVTNVSSNTFTIVRAQEDTTARSIIIGDQIANTITNKTMTDIEANISLAIMELSGWV